MAILFHTKLMVPREMAFKAAFHDTMVTLFSQKPEQNKTKGKTGTFGLEVIQYHEKLTSSGHVYSSREKMINTVFY